jgi:hydrogenase maturation protease
LATSLILGIGNVLLTDDGAGVHAARVLTPQLAGRPDVQVVDGGTLSFTLAPLIERATRLIVLDAMQLREPPGTVHHFLGTDVDAVLGRARLSVHEIRLRDVLQLVRLAGSCPAQRALIGIQPADLDWGTVPGPAVSAALPTVCALALRLLDTWPSGTRRRMTLLHKHR